MATLQRGATDTDSLYELERGTQDVVTVIMQNLQAGGGGGSIKIPGVEKVHPKIPPRRYISDFVSFHRVMVALEVG